MEVFEVKLDGITQRELNAELLRILRVVGPALKRYSMREVVTEVYAELAYDPDDEELEIGTEWLAPFVDAACERLRKAGLASAFADGPDGGTA
jgi:hypothetical protein